jgi:zinc transport system ATP-binding protein
MTSPQSAPLPQTRSQPASLAIKNLRCSFGSAEVVCGINLDLTPGEHVAVIGGNGSGKTTVLRAVMGLHPEWTGAISINGSPLSPRPAAAHPSMAWMPQRQPRGQFPYTVDELLASSRNTRSARDWAGMLGIAKLGARPLSALSGGQLQRAFLARALGALDAGAGLLLADEPTAALDFQGQEQIAQLLSQLPATILVVTHDPVLARTCHRVLHMAQGSMREAAW